MIVRHLLFGASAFGVDVTALKQRLRLDDALLADRDGRIPGETYAACWVEAARESGDPAFGLHLAERAPKEAYDVLHYLASTSATCLESLQRIAKYFRVLDDTVRVRVSLDAERLRVVQAHEIDAERFRHRDEMFLGSLLLRGRLGVGEDWSPIEVCFPHEAPSDDSEHRRIFGACVKFGCATAEMSFDASFAHRAFAGADPTLSAILEHEAAKQIARLPTTPSFAPHVAETIALALRRGDASLGAVAKLLKMHPRSLQRQLVEAGTTFQDLLADKRHEAALEHLADPKKSLTEITFLLGFSRPSAFHRAFRRRAGVTPLQYRDGLGV